ncbi:uncharacterized protein BXZ73DRAFT_49227 [Epithele typhae]|uniref:uncharacterized protein n=1 Tax=Epithele typhae TaxID=378194 RepID=UPI00200857DF|nr:uncharacterized protein BXZ73DRAFT_49227 [Epithele typhae]KAH9926652.1 hypothetical protein BXZ73DRAFT_49227 [Epithele typhae]
MKALPPELWDIIIRLLNHNHQRKFLLLSRKLHAIVFPLLFHHVNLHFGPWSPDVNQRMDEGERWKLNIRTEEILWEISTRPTFAAAIRAVTVQAFLASGHNADRVFEIQLLLRALRALSPSLYSLRWFEFANRPLPASWVLPTVAGLMGANLLELHLPITCLTHPALGAFTNLRRFELDIGPDGDLQASSDSHMDLIDESDLEKVRQTVFRNRTTLDHLVAPGALIWRLPSRTFEGLHTLEITCTATVDGLGVTLLHCKAIRDFSLMYSGPDDGLETIVGQLSVHKLPLLTAFKIVFKEPFEEGTFIHFHILCALAGFLRGRTELRRLHVQPAYLPPEAGEDASSPLADVIPTLPNLTTLGLEFKYPLCLDRLDLLEKLIPRGITALRLDCSLNPGANALYEQAFLSILRGLPSVRYLHIFNEIDGESPLKDQLREDPPPALDLLGFGPFVRWLVPSPDLTVESLPEWSPRWPLWKLRFRAERDFGNADWAWLMRHRLPCDGNESERDLLSSPRRCRRTDAGLTSPLVRARANYVVLRTTRAWCVVHCSQPRAGSSSRWYDIDVL